MLPKGSCSRIWQRDSYWDARPSSRRYFGRNYVWIEYQELNILTWYTFFSSAMNIPFSYLDKIIALLLEKTHGLLIKAQAILELLQWNLRREIA